MRCRIGREKVARKRTLGWDLTTNFLAFVLGLFSTEPVRLGRHCYALDGASVIDPDRYDEARLPFLGTQNAKPFSRQE
jgi:hypothetical protein